ALAPQRWRRGEKGIGAAVGLALAGTLAWGLYGYVLPVVFGWVGQVLGAATAAAIAIALFCLLPVFTKGVKRLARALHKALIRYDPFAELAAQKEKMIASRSLFKTAKARIKAIQVGMEREAAQTENEARAYRDKVQALQAHAQTTRHRMRQLEGQLGEGAADNDAYVALQTDLMKTLGEGQRLGSLLDQSTALVGKYGSRASVVGKLDRKLSLVEAALDVKISDFTASIAMLQKEYAFAEAARQATQTARSALRFAEGWELTYALDVVTGTIERDLAVTRENLLDLQQLTNQYAPDNDELYARLESLANGLRAGTPAAAGPGKSAHPAGPLSARDPFAAGFGDIFN
ncbi:MAG TPA: hypothetical protein VF646_14940, partial [Cytophagales bacterium]